MRIHLTAACLGAALVLAGCGGGGGGDSKTGGAPSPAAPAATAPAPAANATPVGQAIGTASITGRVSAAGKLPPRRPITMTADPGCKHPEGEALSDDLLVGGDGSVQNVWVRVVSGLGDRAFSPPAEPVALDQHGCTFTPHAVTAQTGQTIAFHNGDTVAHNVHALPKTNAGFNMTVPPNGKPSEKSFAKPEPVRVKCDIHPWMGSWVFVNDTPFQALTGTDGRYEIKGLPAGTYEVEAWHERLGTTKQTVTVGDGESKTADFSYAPGGKSPGSS
ncbi:MAG TPA: carboxypeptidase regulatory-like domain-containing protein [Candidatus Polarisedimenticolia bacterium]|jgi:plastocyanin|nr:carboxypeptidase regulatory-like domain-containing protein [Candidatus Polarisedimenticolia bacterium]